MVTVATSSAVDRACADLVDYVLATRHDTRYTDAGVAAGVALLLDEVVAAAGEDGGE